MAFDESQAGKPDSDVALDCDTAPGPGSLRLRCKACGAVLVEGARFVRVGGTSIPVFVNPAGMFFELLLVDDVSQVFAVGPFTTEATWFAGYGWRCLLCRHCVSHVGWRWEAAALDQSPHGFSGMIRDKVVLESTDQTDHG